MTETPSLSLAIRESTRAQHTDAENQSFVSSLMKGELSLEDYTRYLVELAWVYDALEAQSSTGEMLVSSESLWDPALNRCSAITHDLAELGISDWRTSTAPLQATRDYIAHLNSLGGKSDVRLIAHHYTRYLGDLSGGQAIASLVARHYGASAEQLSFYDFSDIGNIVRYKDDYRGTLDSLAITVSERETLIAEAQKAFEFNSRIFAELAVAA